MAKLGVMIEGQEGLNWDRWNRIVEAAEGLGFDSVWRSDHLFSVMGAYDRETLALWPSLTAVGSSTSRVEFGQLVSPTTFRHPVHLAFDAVALDHLSEGRFYLGVGAGWNEREHAGFGFPLPPVKERMDRFEEALKVMKMLWTGDSVSFAGEHFQLDMARMGLKPRRPAGVPLMIGGGGERRLLRLVAEYADEWNVTATTIEDYARKVEALNRHCADVGRDPTTIRRSMMIGHLVGRDQDEIYERAERLKQVTGRVDADTGEMLEAMSGRGWFIGTPDEVVEQIKTREAQGLERFMLQTLVMDDIDMLELVANEVLPRVA
jgi:F420-dependent oxidoreductase-like protein